MNKIVTIVLIVLLSIITLGLAVGLYFAVKTNYKFGNWKFNYSFNNLSTTLIEEKEISSIKDLNIKTDVADVFIEEYDNNTIKVELYSENPKNYGITEEEGRINVVLEEKIKIGFNALNKVANVKIYVPKEYSNNIVTDTNVGDVRIKNLPNATLNTKISTGDLKVINIKNVTAAINVGDIKIEKVNKLTSDVRTGDLKIQYVNDLVSKNKTGDVKIENINGSINSSIQTGDIKIQNAKIDKNSKLSTNVGDIKIQNISGCYVEGKTNVGDVKIYNNERKADVELNITSQVGDIKVY